MSAIDTVAYTSCAAPLVFSRARAIGTVVGLQSAATAAGTVDFMLLDDGTGVAPVALAAPACNGGRDRAMALEMAQRWALLTSAGAPCTGTTIEVLGKLRYNHDDSRLPPVWIECTHISPRSDPMAETTGTLDTLAAYRLYISPDHCSQGAVR